MARKATNERGSYQKREDVMPKIDGILDAIAGGASLRKACNEAGIAHSTFLNLVMNDEALFDRYTRARKMQAAYLFDTLGAIEDGTLAKKIDPQAAKVVIDSRKWRLAKLHPKEYGEKSQVDMISSDGSMSAPKEIVIKLVDPHGQAGS